MTKISNKHAFWIVFCAVFSLLFSYTNIVYGNYEKQQITVQGTVTDNDGNTLAGVSIGVKGTTEGVLTDQNGKYSLSLPAKSEILVFSFIGMQTQEVVIGSQTSINIIMSAATIGLEEVVVIGYGTMKKKDLTGSVASVKTDRLLSEKPQAVQDMLRGNIAGLEVGFSTTAKGGGSLQIRGDNSLLTSSYPLIVVDGVIYPGALEDINPFDIQTIDVLKDASSAAVYGARSANGVILITTTKKGVQKKPIINFSSSIGVATMATTTKPYDAYKFISWRQDVLRSMNWYSSPANTKLYLFDDPSNLKNGITMTQWLDGKTGDPQDIWLSRLGLGTIEINNYHAGTYVDWWDKVFQKGLQQDYNLSMSGQKEETTYYWSIGYNNNKGIIVGDQFKTVRSRLNLESNVTKWLTVGLNSQFSSRDQSGAVADWWQAVNNSPWGSFYKDDGVTMRWSSIDDPVGSVNPLYAMSFTENKNLTTDLISSLYAKIKLPLGITYQINASPRLEFFEQYIHLSAQSDEWKAFGGQASREQSKVFSWQIDNLIKWNKTFNDIHQIDITLLANTEKYQSWENYMSEQGFSPTDALGYHNMSVGTSSSYQLRSNDEYSTGNALMARAFYSLKSRYMLTASLRRDGYSAFGLKHPYGIFPALALGWVFTDENFLKNDFFYGKLRFSWGANGNREIGRYAALSDMGVGKLPYETLGGSVYQSNQLYVNHMSNPDLRWEKTQSTNIGMDFSIKKGLIDGSIELYDKLTKDLLVNRLLPDVTGYTSVATNLGEVQNKGIELTLNARIMEKKDFLWRTSVTFSSNRNKIIHLYGDMIDVKDASGNVIGKREADDITNGWFIGHAIDQIWQPKILGVWQIGQEAEAARYAQYPGDFHIQDVNNDGKIDNLDNVFQGYRQPRFRWNMRNEFNIYKNLNFSFSMYSYWGNYGSYDIAMHAGKPERGNDYNVSYWTPENPINDFARIRTYSGGASFNVWREKSFIRLDNVTLAYTIPTAICDKIHINNVKIFGTIRNAALWAAKWHFWDPEYSGPNPRYFNLGINMTI